MTSFVSVDEKRVFVEWFLRNHQLKRRECVWILNYLLSDEAILERVHFTDEAHYCPRAMVMSTTDTPGIPFRFYKGNIMTSDAEKSFHDLRLHDDEAIYIQLNFQNVPPSTEYLAVLEENPYMPQSRQSNQHDRIVAEQLVNESLHHFQEEKLLVEIDEALDRGDKNRFIELSQLLKKIRAL
ncbi:MAG: ReoY family proteolytic degradation factor [Caryophanon sp.]|nr:ReoY family proteolytic degradation factor [Caryophanon sp.]